MSIKSVMPAVVLGLTVLGGAAQADPIIYESFANYPDNALISDSPAGPAIGLTGDWSLDPGNYFYVNMTESDHEAASGKAVYDMPWDDNGARTAQRKTALKHALAERDGDRFYASFRIQPPRADGHMLFRLEIDQLDGGGQPELSFGIKDGYFVIGNGGVNVDVQGGAPTPAEMHIVLRVEYGESDTGPDDLELVTLWLDPFDENSSPVIDEVPLDLVNPGGIRIHGVSIRGDQMDGLPAHFDDLLVGYAFADVMQGPPAASLTNHSGMNGLFYDSESPGHGFNFIVHQYGLSAYYFGHNATGERLWLVSEPHDGDLEFGTSFVVELYEVLSGTFGQPQQPETSWGSATFTLLDCDSGQAVLNGQDGHLEMYFVRLSTLPGIGCQ